MYGVHRESEEVIEVDLDDEIQPRVTVDNVAPSSDQNKNNLLTVIEVDPECPDMSTNRLSQRGSSLNNSSYFKMRLMNLVLFGAAILTGIVSISVYMTGDENEEGYLLYCLEFYTKANIPFQTYSYSIIVILCVFGFCLLTSIVMTIKAHEQKMKMYFKDTFPYLPICLLTLIASFLIADFTDKRTYFSIVFNFVLALVGFLSLLVLVYRIRDKTFDTKLLIITECFFESSLFALVFYSLLFNFIQIITRAKLDSAEEEGSDLNFACNITANIIYFFSAIIFLTIFKDIVYPSCVVIIETGLINNPLYYFSEILVSIIVVILIFFSVVWTVFKYKYKVFKLNIEEN